MVIPLPGAAPTAGEPETWTALRPEDKCERLLSAAAGVFTRHGLEAPMSEVAEAAGAGVASVYRQFPSKHELLATLVIRRLDHIADAARAAQASPGDRWTALTAMLRSLVAGEAVDDFLGEARAVVAEHSDVQAATERATTAIDRLLSDARGEGRLRSDATTLDVRLLFAATRAARRVEPEQWPRMLELMIAALDSSPPR